VSEAARRQDDGALTRRGVALMLLALAVAAAPHLGHAPAPVLLFGLACGLWRWMTARAAWPLPGIVLRALLTIAALAGVTLAFGTVFGRDAGTALLIVMLSLKLLEMRSYRDAMLVLFLGCFLTVVMAFHSQEIATAVMLVAALLLLVAAMIELNHPPADARRRGSWPALRFAGVMLLQATPLMLLMFVLFPRLPAPLWALPADAGKATTGLSETMTPGSVSELAGSDAVAFRVTFDGETPASETLYWRGPVFWHTDGRNWSADARRATPQALEAPAFTPLGTPIRYTVMMEPSHQRWLFALDLPHTAPAASAHTADLFLLAERPVHDLRRYVVTSYSDYRTGPLREDERRRALQLPDANPRSIALARAWREESRDDAALADAAVVQRALRHFREQAFHYTLTPPPLGEHPIDAFLFDSRRGFCEHYAAAFTVLMRAAGVPARVVTGYQGGEHNPIGGYLLVRQRDAHAWAEVWLEERGWTRIDPTAAVAPERIARGGGRLFERAGAGMRGALHDGLVGDFLERARHGWDVLNIRWDAWVLAYGPQAQETLLARFGLRSWAAMLGGMVATVTLSLLLLLLVWRRQRRGEPLAELHARFRAKLARRGVVAAPAEGPVDFAGRARRHCPQAAEPIDHITRLYVAMRYGSNYSPKDIGRQRRAVADFRP
jgi:transglutaminase-like putative cysteine protease